jgi:2-enoate reductase
VVRLWDWYNDELEDSTVKVRLSTDVTPALVEKEAPDALVIAIGAEQIWPDWPGMDKKHVASAVEVLRDVKKYKGRKAVVVGGGDVGCETACHLADNGWEVTIVEILPHLMEENIMKNVKLQMFNLLEEKKVKVMTETKVNALTDGGVEVILPNGKQWCLDADLAAIAVGFKKTEGKVAGSVMTIAAHEGLAAAMSMHADEVHIIGDAANLGRIYEATQAGERVGRNL